MPAASEGSGALWEQICSRLSGSFPVGIAAILGDPLQVSGSYDGAGTLDLTIKPGFASNMVDRPDVTAKLGALAAELEGRPVQVRTMAPGAAPKQKATYSSKLDELGKHEVVKFK